MAGCQRGKRGRGRSKTRSDDGWSGWRGYMNAKIEKLGKQGLPPKASDIFKGVAIFVNGYTKPPQEELKRLVLANGGAYIHYYRRRKVTHIIASNLPTSKIERLRDEKVVRPDWITDCLSAGRVLPLKDYLLYDPKGSGHNTSLLTSLRKSSDSMSSTSNGFHGLASTNTNSAALSSTSIVTTLEDELFPWSELESSELTRGNNGTSFMETDAEMTLSNVDEECLTTSTGDTTAISDHSSENVVEDSGCVTENVTRNFDPRCEKMDVVDRTAASAVAKAGDPGFVSEFYNNSRLHHLSTWGAEFKAYVTSLQGRANCVFSGREKLRDIVASRDNSEQSNLKETGKVARLRVMMHIDMDCFFVSVALRNRSELKGRPVAVTHSKGKGPAHNEAAFATEKAFWDQRSTGKRPLTSASGSKPIGENCNQNGAHNSGQPVVQPTNKDVFYSMAEIASCSYEARKAGVKNGMLFGKAKQLCPGLIPVSYDFEGYREVSQQLYDTVGSYTLEIEAVSCDELYVDCTDVVADTGASPLEFSSLLRREIFEKTGCTASAGLGGNMLLARLATKVAKPDGQLWVEPEKISDFIKDILVSDLPGVGRVMSSKLETLNVRTCQQLQSFSLPVLQKHFGQKTGQMLFRYARGEDERTLKSAIERKSVSAEINYGIRFTKISEAEKFLSELSAEVQSRLRNINRKGKTVTLKLKVRQQDAPKVTAKFMGHGICDSLCKSSALPLATDNADIIAQECCSLLRQIKVDPEDLRGMGIQMTFLEAPIGQTTSTGCRSILDFAAPTAKDRTPEPRPVSTSTGKTVSVESASVSVTSVNHQPVRKSCASVAEMMQGGSRLLSNGVNRTITSSAAIVSHCIIKKSSDANSLPPLPSLGDVNSGVEETDGGKGAGRCAQVSYDNDPYLPSPSQIDEKVLEELPEDIRMEIREALEKKRRKLEQEFGQVAETNKQKNPLSKGIVIADGEQPGCSHWTDDGPMSHLTTEAIVVYDPMALPPYSQLDASYMNALPDELRDEIESAYAAGTKEQIGNAEVEMCASPQKDLHPLMRTNIRNSSNQPLHKTSPLRKNSPKKSPAKRTSPSFKVPTGKPPGKRKNLAKKRIQFPVKPPARYDILATSGSSVQVSSNEHMAIDSHLIDEASKLRETGVSVAGCITLDQVKGLLRSWMQKSSIPDDEDLNTFFQYLIQLIDAKNLERVNILLKFINRIRLDQKISSEWKTGSQWLIDQTQLVVQSVYGGPIKLPTY